MAAVNFEKSLLCPRNSSAVIRNNNKVHRSRSHNIVGSHGSRSIEKLATVCSMYSLAHCPCMLLIFKYQLPFCLSVSDFTIFKPSLGKGDLCRNKLSVEIPCPLRGLLHFSSLIFKFFHIPGDVGKWWMSFLLIACDIHYLFDALALNSSPFSHLLLLCIILPYTNPVLIILQTLWD